MLLINLHRITGNLQYLSRPTFYACYYLYFKQPNMPSNNAPRFFALCRLPLFLMYIYFACLLDPYYCSYSYIKIFPEI